jgi:hypothetical protein
LTDIRGLIFAGKEEVYYSLDEHMALSGLDELTLSCRNEEARGFVAEAVSCYKAGAFRSCIVAAWIAVVYDLLAKIRELALGGDAEAQRLTSELASLQPNIESGNQPAIRRILEIERDIVNIANDKFRFFEGQQVTDLLRLRDDRNRCAHPTYQGTELPYAPSAELARAHLVHAVAHVLAVPPVQGKAATDHIIRLVESNFFPTEVEKAKIQLRSGGLDRPKDSLVRSVIDQLVFELVEGRPQLKANRRTVIAARAVYEMYPGICEPRLRKCLNSLGRRVPDDDLVILFGIQRHIADTWNFLEIDNQTRLTELVRQASDEIAKRLLPICLSVPALAEVSAARIDRFDYEQIASLVETLKHPALIARGVDIYCSSKSWDQANLHYRAIEPALEGLTPDQLRRIISAHTQEGADLNGAHSFTKFLKYIYDRQKLPREEIVALMQSNNLDWLISRIESSASDDDVPF